MCRKLELYRHLQSELPILIHELQRVSNHVTARQLVEQIRANLSGTRDVHQGVNLNYRAVHLAVIVQQTTQRRITTRPVTTLHYLFHRAPLGGRTNSVNVIVEPLPIGLGLNNCIRVDPWSRLSIPEGRKLFLVGDLRLSHPINKVAPLLPSKP
ncbi:hypothetical protein J6590_040650 [Homalodisca vitripennis]|nr:hypothetical protein J6590_040650 [Homalodisca vitripennis]